MRNMPATAPAIPNHTLQRLRELGARVHARRKALGVAAADAAQAAGLSRVTLYRIEQGEPSVTMGACANVLEALGLGNDLGRVGAGGEDALGHRRAAAASAPAAVDLQVIELHRYPQLKQLAWQRHTPTVTGQEALSLYERNWRHVDQAAMPAHERELVAALAHAYGHGALLV